jgi:hypothetical protein
MINKFPEVLNFNRLFLKLNRFTCNYAASSPRSLFQGLLYTQTNKAQIFIGPIKFVL